MANAFVRGANNSSASASTLATTIVAPANGNTLIVIVGSIPSAGNNPRTVSSITCTNVTGFAKFNSLSESVNHESVEIWLGNAGASAGTSLTVNMSATAAPLLVVVWEFSGDANALDFAMTGSTGNLTGTASTGTYSAPTAGDLEIIAFVRSSGSVSVHPSGFTAPVSGQVTNGSVLEADYLLSGTSGAQSAATWTLSNNENWVATGVGLKVPAAAASPVFRRTLSGLGTRTGARQGR